MYFVFLISAFALIYAVFYRKRIVDLFSVLVVSLNVYYLPLYFGVLLDPVSREYEVPHEGVYVVFVVVNFLSVLAVVCFDRFAKKNVERKCFFKSENNLVFTRSFLLILSFMTLFVFDYSYFNLGSKVEIMNALGIRYTMFMALALLISVYATVYRDRVFFVIGIGLLLSTFVIGSRSAFVLFALVVVVDYFVERGKRVKVLSLFNMLFVILSVLFIASSKHLYEAIILHGIAGGVGVYLERFTMATIIGGLEGQSTQYILNKVIESGFSVPVLHVPQGFLRLLPLPSSAYGVAVTDFNELFQPALFPSINYGLAFNPWAEAYSWAGYLGVFVMAMFYLLVIYALNWQSFFNGRKVIRVLCVVVGVYFAFWLHRNSLGSILSYVRNVIYPFLAAWFFASCISFLFFKRSSRLS